MGCRHLPGEPRRPWWHYIFFVLLTLLVALPVILVLALGQRGRVFLPKARDWMSTNSLIISEVVIGLFIVITANSLAG